MKLNELDKEIQDLLEEGIELANELHSKKINKLMVQYEPWYSKSLLYIKKISPDRVLDFKCLYKLEKRKEITYASYTISDALIGVTTSRGVDPSDAYGKLIQQITILKGAREMLKSKVYEMQELLQADIFDNELNSARELNKKGFYRAAGAICGVVLEAHFSKVLEKYNITISKKNPTINDYNEILKSSSIVDITTFRLIQLLGDIRNLCDHRKKEDPTKEQINDLISGTEKIIKTVF